MDAGLIAEKKRSVAASVMGFTSEEMGDGDKDYCTKRSRGKRVPEAAAEDSQLGENPAADKGTDQAQNNISDAAEAAAARDFSREPAGDQAQEKPRHNAVGFEPDSINSLRK
jgi:hypothetical protein